MPKFPDVVSIEPKTVTKVSKDEVNLPKVVYPKQTRNLVDVTVMNKEVWTTALKLANKQRARIEVISPECVVVHNGTDRNLWPQTS